MRLWVVFAVIFVPFCIFQIIYIECINTGLKKKNKKRNTISFNMRVFSETMLQEKWNGVGWGHRGRKKTWEGEREISSTEARKKREMNEGSEKF